MKNLRENLKVVLIQLRTNEPKRIRELASYARSTKLPPECFVSVDLHVSAPSTSLLDRADALIVAGSKYSVWEEVPHLAELSSLVRSARDRKIPMFGVCFGAQLFAHLFGGRVTRDAENGEWGTVEISTTDEALDDAIFVDLPFTFLAQEAHQDRITNLPPGSSLLASNDRCQVQAFFIPSANAYGVQFHPERSKTDTEQDIAINPNPDQKPREDQILATLKESPKAESVLTKFIDRIVLPK